MTNYAKRYVIHSKLAVMVLYAPDYTKLGGSHRNVKRRGMGRLHIIPQG